MKLQRLTWLELRPVVEVWVGTEFDVNGVRVRLGEVLEPAATRDDVATRCLLVGEIELGDLPATSDSSVVVPEQPRLRAELAIETIADSAAVLLGGRRALYSPAGHPIAFEPQSDSERAWLGAKTGVAGAQDGRSRALFHPQLQSELLRHLDGREDGVRLLAQAAPGHGSSQRFRELIRLYERAFSCSGNALVERLSAFLARRPAFNFTKTEIKQWITRLRGPAVHADRRRVFLDDTEVERVVERMFFAGHDVLFNKNRWRASEPGFRDVWRPRYGPLDAETTITIAGERLPIASTFYDQFGVYPVSLSTFPDFSLPAPAWPGRRVRQEWKDRLSVVSEDELMRIV